MDVLFFMLWLALGAGGVIAFVHGRFGLGFVCVSSGLVCMLVLLNQPTSDTDIAASRWRSVSQVTEAKPELTTPTILQAQVKGLTTYCAEFAAKDPKAHA